jgi:hypothetical protein
MHPQDTRTRYRKGHFEYYVGRCIRHPPLTNQTGFATFAVLCARIME